MTVRHGRNLWQRAPCNVCDRPASVLSKRPKFVPRGKSICCGLNYHRTDFPGLHRRYFARFAVGHAGYSPELRSAMVVAL